MFTTTALAIVSIPPIPLLVGTDGERQRDGDDQAPDERRVSSWHCSLKVGPPDFVFVIDS